MVRPAVCSPGFKERFPRVGPDCGELAEPGIEALRAQQQVVTFAARPQPFPVARLIVVRPVDGPITLDSLNIQVVLGEFIQVGLRFDESYLRRLDLPLGLGGVVSIPYRSEPMHGLILLAHVRNQGRRGRQVIRVEVIDHHGRKVARGVIIFAGVRGAEPSLVSLRIDQPSRVAVTIGKDEYG